MTEKLQRHHNLNTQKTMVIVYKTHLKAYETKMGQFQTLRTSY